MADWTSQEPQIATEEHTKLPWGGGRPGQRFRCYLCGHKFKPGDRWRFVLGGNVCGNLLVCETCDGDDVREKFAAAHEELKTRFWWALDPDRCSAV